MQTGQVLYAVDRCPAVKQRDAWNKLYLKHRRAWDGFADTLWITEHLKKGSEILELGSGNGKTLVSLLKEGYTCTGVDFSEAAVERIKERMAGTEEMARCRLIVSDVTDLPQDIGRFDAVVMVYLLNHLTLPEASALFERTPHLLKKGGMAFAEAFGPGDMRNSLGRTERRGIRYHYHAIEEWEKLEGGGLKMIDLRLLRREKRYGSKQIMRESIRGVWKKI